MTYLSIAARAATAALMLAAAPALAQTTTYGTGTVALGTTPYTQNFDGLVAGGTLPTGFRAVEVGSNANSSFAVGTGSGNAGDVYSFGTAGSTDRALGGLQSGSLIPTIGAIFSNATGQTITSLVFGYTGEQWRNGGTNSADLLNFQYSVSSTNIGDAATSPAWIGVSSLNFVSPVNTGAAGALDGNAASTVLTGTVSGLSIAANALFAIRFLDVDALGADDGLAVDNLSVSAVTAPVTPPVVAAVPEPATWAMLIAGFGVVGATLRRRRRVAAFS